MLLLNCGQLPRLVNKHTVSQCDAEEKKSACLWKIASGDEFATVI
jgi:hypothetical protein